tara:strand:+ start:1717 stop:1881 length:165 start_codon:yes stop_codon:yes gene_type:complete
MQVSSLKLDSWLEDILDQAIRETGFFGNQNSAARPRAFKWRHTVDRLKNRVGIE